MYATVRNYSSGGELVDALVDNEGEIRGLLSGIEGFRAYYAIRTSGGEVVTVSVFDDQTGAEESTRVAAAWVAENLAGTSVSPPQVTSGEVALSF